MISDLIFSSVAKPLGKLKTARLAGSIKTHLILVSLQNFGNPAMLFAIKTIGRSGARPIAARANPLNWLMSVTEHHRQGLEKLELE